MTDRIAIVAHDAGGAELLAAHVHRLPAEARSRYVLALEGPARQIFARRGLLDSLPLEQALSQCNRILCGTGWQSRHEWEAIRLARQQGKHATAFLDHWVNYRERFLRDGIAAWPDALWVSDTWALARAQQELPHIPAHLQSNPLLQEVRETIAARRPTAHPTPGLRLLFLGEPIGVHATRQHGNERHWGYTEHDALGYLLAHLGALPSPVAHVVVRPHPAEATGWYDRWLTRSGSPPVTLSTSADLLDDILAADWVAGCNTMGLVIALEAHRRALCCIPPGGRPCVLPHDQIQPLSRLIAEQTP